MNTFIVVSLSGIAGIVVGVLIMYGYSRAGLNKNQQKAEQSVSTINLIDADYSGYPDIEINQNNRYLLKTLVDKYTTKEIDDNFVKWYEFESAFTPHEYYVYRALI